MSISYQSRNNRLGPAYTVLQISFSTADIERNIFYGERHVPIRMDQPINDLSLLGVHGDLFLLKDEPPPGSIPLTEDSGVFQIVGLDQQA